MRIIIVLFVLTVLNPSFASEPHWNHGGELHITESITSTNDIQLSNELTLNVDASHTVSLRGIVSVILGSPGSLVKTGAGRLELWGDNRYLDNLTTLQEGTLHLAARYALGEWGPELQAYPGTTLSYADGVEIPATLNTPPAITNLPGAGYDRDAIQWRVDDGVAAHTGIILSAVPLIKLGTGTLRLREAASASTSHLTISEGTVQLENQFSGHIVVGNAAFLTGGHRLGRLTIHSGGTLAPAGRFQVEDAVTFQPDSHFQVRAWADGQHDSVHVDGTASLDGHVLALPQGAAQTWQQGVEYVIVDADGGLGNSRFASVESALPYLEPSLSYSAQKVSLTLVPLNTTPDPKSDPKPDPKPDPTPDKPVNPTTPAAPPETATQTPHADTKVPSDLALTTRDLDAPETKIQTPVRKQPLTTQNAGWPATVRNQLTDDSRFLRDAVYRHAMGHNSFWSHAFHSSDERQGAVGDIWRARRKISGLLLGASIDVSPKLRLGVFGGGSHTQAIGHHAPAYTPAYHSTAFMPTLRPSSRADAMHAGLYTAVQGTRGTTFTVGAAQSWHRLRNQRPVHVVGFNDALSSHYGARTFQVFGSVSRPLWASAANDSTLAPFADIAWVQTRQKAHTETGGPLALHVAAERQSVLLTTLGLRASHRITSGNTDTQLTGSLGWRHARGDTAMPLRHYFRDDITATSFTSDGLPIQRSMWQLRLGVQTTLGKHASLGLEYAGQLNRHSKDHGVQAGLRIRW